MERSFSFSEKPVLFILHKFPFLLPGIKKIITIHFDNELEKLYSYSLIKKHDDFILEESDVNDSGDTFDKFRKVSTPWSWTHPDDIPYKFLPKQHVQLEIFNELNINILLLRIKNQFDGLNDLFFIYFSNNLSHFGILDSKKAFTTDNKTIIGHLLGNSIFSFLSNYYEDRERFIGLSENHKSVIQDLAKTKKELNWKSEKNKDVNILLCNSYLENISNEYGYNFELSPEAIKKIKDYDEDPVMLKVILRKAAEYAQSTLLEKNFREIIIEDHHLILNIPRIKKAPEIIPMTVSDTDIPVRYNRTFHFLNKLETAAETVKSKNLLLTSINVGHEFPSPVTPAAITDALKNHQSKILYLFKLLPNRWQIIRTEFRPVQNILNPKIERQKQTG